MFKFNTYHCCLFLIMMIMTFNNDPKGFVRNDPRTKEFTIKITYLPYLIRCFYSRADKIYLLLNTNRYDYDEKLCSNCESALGSATTRQADEDNEEEEIVMNYLLRLMTASSKLTNTLKRQEYRT